MGKLRIDNRPLYELAKDGIMNILVQSSIGDRLPSEEELSKKFGISRNTLREAIKILAREGWIVQRQGIGTFVSKTPHAIDSGLEKLESLDTMAQRNNWQCSTKEVEFKSIIPENEICEILGLDSNAMVTVVNRIKLINGHKVAYLIDMVPHSVISQEELEENFKGSVLDILINQKIEPIDYAYTELIPIQAKDYLAKKLGIPRNTNLLLVKETVFSIEGHPLEYALTYMVADFFNFHVIRRLSPYLSVNLPE